MNIGRVVFVVLSLLLLNVIGGDSESADCSPGAVMTSFPHEDAEQLGLEKSEEVYKAWEVFWKAAMQNKIENVFQAQGSDKDEDNVASNGNSDAAVARDIKDESNQTNGNSGKRRWIFSLRHGERVDLTYGSWVPYCFDENGTYTLKDLNLPISLPDRAGGAQAYARDSPLTRVGQLQARLVGEGLRQAGVRPHGVYASPALRCVETAHHMLQGLQADPSVKIKIEPGLFEAKMWYVKRGLDFMTPLEFHKAGYNVDLDYKPYVEINSLDINSPESLQEFYDRNEHVMQLIVKDTEQEGSNLMFVGHATTLDIMVRGLKRLGSEEPPPPYQLSAFLGRVPYCALAAVRDRPLQVVSPPCPPAINSSSGRFDWKLLLDVGNE